MDDTNQQNLDQQTAKYTVDISQSTEQRKYDQVVSKAVPVLNRARPDVLPERIPVTERGFFGFHNLIGGKLLKILYVMGMLALLVFGMLTILDGGWLSGLLIIVIGNMLWRVICELLLIIYRGYDLLTIINHNLSKQKLRQR